MLRSLIRPAFLSLLLFIIISCAAHSPLIQAAGSGQADAIAQLISNGSDVNEVDSDGWTPLLHAAYYGYAPAVRELIRLGADPNAQDDQQWTALHYAADTGRADIAQILVDGGADIYLEDKYGKTARMVAQEYVARGNQPWFIFRIFGAGGGPLSILK